MKRLHWLFFMMCLAVLPALQSCDDLDDGYSIGDFSYPNWSTVRVKGILSIWKVTLGERFGLLILIWVGISL